MAASPSPLQVALADDEPLARERLARLLATFESVELVASLGRGAELLALLKRQSLDLLLLDIRMPGIDGVALAEQLQRLDHPPLIIFVTAYSEYALEAFEVSALDYLLKPVRIERLQQALDKARKVLQLPTDQSASLPSIMVESQGVLQRIPLNQIACFIAAGKYTVAISDSGETILSQSLKQLEQQLGSAVLRIHRNALIVARSLAAIETLDEGTHRVRLHHFPLDESQLPLISRRHLSRVRAQVAQLAL
ncbi:DNA-binding response regulator [Ectothiorhodospiraceae bacterium BW-2]|nr:DNA-binding response regulator [Ectothiorhodospiraceae bacterium BW-2]